MVKRPHKIDVDRAKNDPAYRASLKDKLAPALFKSVLESWIAHGYIDPTGKSRLQVLEEFLKVLRTPRARLSYAIDHTEGLRKIAKELGDVGQHHVQLLVLATWVEHMINSLVSIGAYRRKFPDSEVRSMIRETSIQAKLTWLLPLLGYRAFSKAHRLQLGRLAELRNQYVHYKWDYDSGNNFEKLPSLLTACERSIRYLASYYTRQTLRGSSSLLRRINRRTKAPNSALHRSMEI